MTDVAGINEEIGRITGELAEGDEAVAVGIEKRRAIEAVNERVAQLLEELAGLVLSETLRQNAVDLGAVVAEAGKHYAVAVEGLDGLMADSSSENVASAREWAAVALYQMQGDGRAEVYAAELLTAVDGMRSYLNPLLNVAPQAAYAVDGANANLSRAATYSANSVQELTTYQETIS